MFTMEQIVGKLVSGFAVRLYAAGLALYVGSTVIGVAVDGLNSVSAVFASLP